MSATRNLTHRQMLRRAAGRAVLAPSVHNTQPWRLALRDDSLELRADRDRGLPALDPTGRQLVISCGCALFNARVALAATGCESRTTLLPDPAQPDLLARVEIRPRWGVRGSPLAFLDEAIETRRTNRREFTTETLPAELLECLVRAAAAERSELVLIRAADQRRTVAELSRRALAIENADAAYRAELDAWMTDDPTRDDGVQAMSVPRHDADSPDELPLREFDSSGVGWLPALTHSTSEQCLLLVGNVADDVRGWLSTGQALERVLLEIARAGYAASPFTQVVEVPSLRAELRAGLGLDMWPHVLLRVGHAPPTPPTRRRPLSAVLLEI
ncbi:MAG TPA: nitroreductase family protein [Jatrophihabitantaceae bacterium]|nr:nitroreductase family protein [Jatrophihabitantaceae bacterium]